MVCFLCVVRSLGVSSLAQSNDADAIRGLVQKLFDSYQRKEFDKLISLWGKKSPSLAENENNFRREFATFERIAIKSLDIWQIKIDGDEATVRVTADIALTKANMVQPVERLEKKRRRIELIKEGGSWKIWKFITSEEELAAEIIAAKTEEEQIALLEKDPEFIASDLASPFTLQNFVIAGSRRGYQHGLAIARLVYKVAEKAGNKFVMANALMNEAYIYGWIGTPEKSPELALDCFRKSLKIGEEFKFKDVMAGSLIRSAIIYQLALYDLSQATEYYLAGLKLTEEVGDHEASIIAMNNLGMIYRDENNYSKALELLLRSVKISQARLVSGADWMRLARSIGGIGDIFSLQGNFEQALVYEQKSIEAAEEAIKLGDPYAQWYKSGAPLRLGDIHLRQGNHSLARSYYEKALAFLENSEETLVDKGLLISGAKMGIGEVLAAQNDTLQAISIYQEALKLMEKAGNISYTPAPLLKIGKMYLLRGDYKEALAFVERALKAAEETSDGPGVWQSLVATADIYQKLGQLEETSKALVKAVDIIEHLREQFAGSELDRQRSFEGHMTPYQAMIDFRVGQKQFAEAFSYAQRAKGRTLLELLQNGRVNIDKSASLAEREQEQQLNRKIVSLNREITTEKLKSEPDKKRLVELEEQLKKARLEFEAFRTTLYAAHPELRIQRGEIRPVSFDDSADLILDSKTAVLDFIVTDENVHLFVLTTDASAKPTLNTHTIKIERKSLAEKVERFRRRMENRDYDFQALSHELYDLLLKPAQKQLQNKANLIISPDNILWDLPFQTLLSPELRYLIEDAAISYTPSLSVLREMQLASGKRQLPARASILALGNPALGNRSKELAKFVKMDAELQPLPEAADQVRALRRLYGPTLSKVVTGPAAREELVKEQSARYRILHLATHGILNDVSPMYSHVLLSQTSGKRDEDGLLEAWEMMNLDLNADLVVLAACETARGRASAGEGVIGMSWALFVAGCPRTVVSQWKVEASSTTALMVEFHKRFKTRYGGRRPAVSTAEAMRQAALKVMRDPEYVHPFYWGGFVVVGDGN
jgi:CHAT domain-containing protein